MALDWNRKVEIGGRSRKSANEYPSKSSMNLMVPDEHGMELRKAVPLGIGLFLAVLLFVKFGIVDQYAQVAAAQSQLTEQQVLVSQYQAQLADYDSVKTDYQGYSAASSSGNVNAITVLNMVEQQVMPSASVTTVNLKDNVLTLTLSNVSLDTVGTLQKSLKSQSIVSDVSVSTATTSESASSNVIATMTITLKSDQK